jgi:hypothetical protein
MGTTGTAEQVFSMIDQFSHTILTNISIKGGLDATYELPIEIVTDLLYETEVNDYGFMISLFNAIAVKDNSLHFARIEVANTVSLTRIDTNEPSGRLKWRFIPGTGYSTDDGFFETLTPQFFREYIHPK